MKSFIIISFILLYPIADTEFPYKNGIPTSRGIDYYVKVKDYDIIDAFQAFVKDTIEDVYIDTDNLSQYTDADSLELGRYYIPNGILITNEAKFIDYEINYLNKLKRKNLETNRLVRAVIMHEITHHYVYRIILEMKHEKQPIAHEYTISLRIYPNNDTYGADFIEEGICEYMIQKMGEINPYKNIKYPKSVNEITDPLNRYEIKYKYASIYVKDILDKSIENGRIKDGIKLLLSNKPPTYQEIINPEFFYKRLIY